MAARDIVVIGASAGGIEALRDVLAGMPPEYPGVVLVVVHLSAGGGNTLAAILDRAGPLRVVAAADGAPLVAGRVYVAVADHHLLVVDGHLHLRRGPRENGVRPSADPLFRSAAGTFGPRVVGVILSGALNDGTPGLQAVRQQGGVAVVQDPSDALCGGMPTSALEEVGADYVVPAREIGPLLGKLGAEEIAAVGPPLTGTVRREVISTEREAPVRDAEHPGVPSPWPCPDCNGVLWEIDEGDVLRFRCRVGHAWAAQTLLHEQASSVDAALWVALRALEDRASLLRELTERAESHGRKLTARRFRAESAEMKESIDLLRRLVHEEAPEPETVDE